MDRYRKPPALHIGNTVGVIATAGRVDQVALGRGVAHLEKLGLKVQLGRHLEGSHRYFAGTDANRAEDLQAMLACPDVAAVVCARGGSGTGRLLPYLTLPATPKIVIGASDATSLLLYLNAHQWVSFHGPMVATQFSEAPMRERDDLFLQTLSGEMVHMAFPKAVPLRSGVAEGVLTGGCLSLICTTIGTAYEIATAEAILFIEDTNEAPYRVDRMLSYLKAVKKFDAVRGVIFGQMPGCEPDVLPDIILDTLGDAPFPILFGFPSGHGDAVATLPFGIPVRMDADARTLSLLTPSVAT